MPEGSANSAPGAAKASQSVRNVLADLIGGFQPEEVEVAQQVVRGVQELQVQLWQRQACLTCNVAMV